MKVVRSQDVTRHKEAREAADEQIKQARAHAEAVAKAAKEQADEAEKMAEEAVKATEPPVFKSRQLKKDETVKTQFGDARGTEGNYVLEGPDGNEFIVSADDFKNVYSKEG